MTVQSTALPLPQFDWQWEAFDALDAREVYAMLKLRSDAFVVEQNCVYGDIDGLDFGAWHLFAWSEQGGARELAGYLRVLLPDAQDADVRIGRVVTSRNHRGIKLGNALLERAIAQIECQWPDVAMRLHAQAHLQKFYGAFGFSPVGEIHDEDGIAHVWMRSA
ncbi:GNAT family N-acetyltransferase [Paraburkholderia sp. CNPSo 3272]|uniref:GNAT family N-acetyltransferase n=1 Tax=Paraburkholderia sp. CNPSo 3272 TaxID=2940931 RepID=UPI0020B8488F|nr:GNAT family N-acetyltransferase [Paraburkholderia sp. CNPSo 3272]MCP3727810.1 GNAT family N-acetyltransferase [Paraburkholderia sp. CNPSo 3272]